MTVTSASEADTVSDQPGVVFAPPGSEVPLWPAPSVVNGERQHPAASGPVKRRPPELFTPAEVAALIGQCSTRSMSGIRNRALLTLLYRSGLRISEALALRPSDLNTARRSIAVLHGKGDKASTRFWHPSADDALARWTDFRRAHSIRGGPLFCTTPGGPVSDRYVRDMLHRLAAAAEIDKTVRPHGFRHTFAFELERAGTPVSTISKLLGHSSISVTARYLDHLTNNQAGEDLQAVDLPALDV
jgi:site-specific recombinase XerD